MWEGHSPQVVADHPPFWDLGPLLEPAGAGGIPAGAQKFKPNAAIGAENLGPKGFPFISNDGLDAVGQVSQAAEGMGACRASSATSACPGFLGFAPLVHSESTAQRGGRARTPRMPATRGLSFTTA